MNKVKRETLKIKRSGDSGSIKGSFLAVNFKEGEQYIIYIPSLELSAYGDTYADADDMMRNHVLKDFCESVVSQPEDMVYATLKELGWERHQFFKKELSRTAFVDESGILQEFNLDPDTVIQEEVLAV